MSKPSVEVTESNFEKEVLTYSTQAPVVVFFWAAWSEPSRRFASLLERFAREADNGFRLAKVDIDANNSLVLQYQVKAVPTVKAIFKKRIVADFVGALTEPQIRDFLVKLYDSTRDPETERGQQMTSKTRAPDSKATPPITSDKKQDGSKEPSKITKKNVSQVSEDSRKKEKIIIENIGEMVLIPQGKFKLGISEEQLEELDNQIRNSDIFKQAASLDKKLEDSHKWYLAEIKKRETHDGYVSLPAYYISTEPIKREKWLRFALSEGYKNPSYWQPSHWHYKQTWFNNLKQSAEQNINSFVDFEQEANRNPYSSEEYQNFQLLKAWYEEYGIWFNGFSAIFPQATTADPKHDMALPWIDTYAFCRWLSSKSKKNDKYLFTLPFETEWEKAIKGGKDLIWPWGNSLENIWYYKREKFFMPGDKPWEKDIPKDVIRANQANAIYSQLWSPFIKDSDYITATNDYQLRGIFTHRDTRVASKRPDNIIGNQEFISFLPAYTDIPEWTANTWKTKTTPDGKMGSLENNSNQRTVRGGLLLQIDEYGNDFMHPQIMHVGTPGVNNLGEIETTKYPLSFLAAYIFRTSGSRARGGNGQFRFRVVARDVNEAEKMDIS